MSKMSIQVDPVAQAAANAMLAEFTYRIDHGQAASLDSLCTKDLVFESPLATLDIEGFRVQMKERQNAPHGSRHCVSNIRIVSLSPEKIEAMAVMTVTRIEPVENESPKEGVVVLDCGLTLAKVDAGYKFQKLSLTPFSMIEYKK